MEIKIGDWIRKERGVISVVEGQGEGSNYFILSILPYPINEISSMWTYKCAWMLESEIIEKVEKRGWRVLTKIEKELYGLC